MQYSATFDPSMSFELGHAGTESNGRKLFEAISAGRALSLVIESQHL